MFAIFSPMEFEVLNRFTDRFTGELSDGFVNCKQLLTKSLTVGETYICDQDLPRCAAGFLGRAKRS